VQLLRVTGIRDLPVWFEAGAAKFDFANTTSLFFVQLLLMGWVTQHIYS
jgi:light-harvesting complex I chlorophyll a/b binding protein 5